MPRLTALAVLLLAALLEAGGDALMRLSLHGRTPGWRAGLFLLSALVLAAYAWTVNAPPWDFGTLIGIYVVFFFVVAQLIAWFVFRQAPSGAVLFGGSLIVTGGVVIAAAAGR